MFSDLMKTNYTQTQKIRLPKIQYKTKPLQGEKKGSPSIDGVSARSWIYYTESFQYGYKSQVKRQMASLTKIMTSICVLQLCQKYKINSANTYFKVTDWASKTIGTTANLVGNAWMSIQDLLYGMMLPSGNDAAMVLAENLGAVIYFDKAGSKSLIQEIRSIDLTEDKQSIKLYMFEFILFMNDRSTAMKMYRTRFANPHGMDMLNHYSSCEDMLILSKESMKYPKLKQIVNTKTYKGLFKFYQEGKVNIKHIIWTNTHKLLGERNIFGIKTGITNKAGGCLSTVFKINEYEQKYGIVIVLGCTSTEARFKDTLKIIKCMEAQSRCSSQSELK